MSELEKLANNVRATSNNAGNLIRELSETYRLVSRATQMANATRYGADAACLGEEANKHLKDAAGNIRVFSGSAKGFADSLACGSGGDGGREAIFSDAHLDSASHDIARDTPKLAAWNSDNSDAMGSANAVTEQNQNESIFPECADWIEAAKANEISFVPVEEHKSDLNEDEIIGRISGSDKTEGSCQSLALVYAANKSGLNVLDFRGGQSRNLFSKPSIMPSIAKLDGVNGVNKFGTNQLTIANELLEQNVQEGKEYILSVGKHAAVVKKIGSGYQYLELQRDAGFNGWRPLNTNTLLNRFECRLVPHGDIGTIVEIGSWPRNNIVRNLLSYLNTGFNMQQKG